MATHPSNVTHAISIAGPVLAFLTVQGKRSLYNCFEQLPAGWYALHVKPSTSVDPTVSDSTSEIPTDLPVDCIIAVVRLGASQNSASLASTGDSYCNSVEEVVVLNHHIYHKISAFSIQCMNVLEATVLTKILTELPEAWKLAEAPQGSIPCASPLRKRARLVASKDMETQTCSCLDEHGNKLADGPCDKSNDSHCSQRTHDGTNTEQSSEAARPCCEKALHEYRQHASKQIDELSQALERCQDALVKAELRVARSEAERQRCEETIEVNKKFHAARVAAIEARLSAAESATAKRVADAETAAKKLFETKLLKVKLTEQQLRQKFEEELRSKYDEDLQIAQRARVGMLQGVEWQYEYQGRWCSFDGASSERLMRQYLQYASSGLDNQFKDIIVTSGSHMYEVDFNLMRQTNVATNKARSVRVKCEVPESWQKPPSKLMWQPSLEQMNTQEDSSEVWDAAESLLQRTAHTATAHYASSICAGMRGARITGIRRVENHLLWRRYQQHLAEMEVAQVQAGVQAEGVRDIIGTLKEEFTNMLNDLCGDNYALNRRVNECWLLHGTETDIADKIIEGGFDPRVSNFAGFYGAGTYFSSQSCKCHQYTSSSGEHTVLLCRVALGIPFYAKQVDQSIRRPPPLNDSTQNLHGCIIANEGPMPGHHRGHQAHQEFVIFNGAQAFPQYVISYTV